MISHIAFPCSSLMLLYIATVPLPKATIESGVVEHHDSAPRISAPRLNWQAALESRTRGSGKGASREEA